MRENPNKPEILGLIPARGGSTGLRGKNIRPLDGVPLIARTIMEAQKSEHITRLIVVTDSDEIAQVAVEYGAEVPFERPAEISKPHSHAFEVYKYALEWLADKEDYHPEIVCAMLCTTPLRTVDEIDKCLKKMVETGCGWCFTVNEIEHHPYRAMTMQGDKMIPVFDIPAHVLWANRQELPKMVRFNGGVIAGRAEHILSHDEYNIDKEHIEEVDVRCVEMPVSRAYDIDTLDDFEFVQMLLNRRALK